jgi:hypothetical protein
MPAPALAKIGGGFALALLAAVLVPRLDDSAGDAPALTTLFVSAVCVAALTTAALYLALARDLRLPRLIVGYVVAYNVLVVFVKFVLSPEALYERSGNGTLEALLFDPNDLWGAALVASLVFGLYAAALYVIYRVCRRKLEDRRWSLSWKRVLVGAVLVVALVFSSGGIALLLAFGGLEYLGFVFSSGVSLVVALSLAGAASLAGIAFRDTAQRAHALGDPALLVSVFWVALVFLALYHVLWVVYVLVLTTIWPLKVITPK